MPMTDKQIRHLRKLVHHLKLAIIVGGAEHVQSVGHVASYFRRNPDAPKVIRVRRNTRE